MISGLFSKFQEGYWPNNDELKVKKLERIADSNRLLSARFTENHQSLVMGHDLTGKPYLTPEQQKHANNQVPKMRQEVMAKVQTIKAQWNVRSQIERICEWVKAIIKTT